MSFFIYRKDVYKRQIAGAYPAAKSRFAGEARAGHGYAAG